MMRWKEIMLSDTAILQMCILDGRALEGLKGVDISDEELGRIALMFNPQVLERLAGLCAIHCFPRTLRHTQQSCVVHIVFPCQHGMQVSADFAAD